MSKREYLTVSASDMLGDYELKVALEQSEPATTETVLVAPNKQVQKLWRKEYPCIKVILQADYKGYPAPPAITKYLGVQPKARRGLLDDLLVEATKLTPVKDTKGELK